MLRFQQVFGSNDNRSEGSSNKSQIEANLGQIINRIGGSHLRSRLDIVSTLFSSTTSLVSLALPLTDDNLQFMDLVKNH
jgi:hypothetical protein